MARDTGGTLRVVIAQEDDARARELERGLAAHERLSVVGRAQTVQEAIDLAETLEPHAVLIDLARTMNATAAIRAIRQLGLRTRVIALTESGSRAAIRAAQDAGADGFVAKDQPAPAIADAFFTAASLGEELGPQH